MMGIPMNQPVHWLYKCNKHSFVGPSVPHFITVCHDGHDGHDRNVFHPSKGEQKATQELLNCRGKSNLRKILTGFSGVYEFPSEICKMFFFFKILGFQFSHFSNPICYDPQVDATGSVRLAAVRLGAMGLMNQLGL
jgi:hypothetical protein